MQNEKQSSRVGSAKVEMGSGFAPPRIIRHIQSTTPPADATPKVEMGSGLAPPRLIRHVQSATRSK
jgi:hypothetical protein